MRFHATLIRSVAAALIVAVSATDAQAQAMNIRIEQPLPAELHDRAIALLKRIRPSDFAEALPRTKVIWRLGSWDYVIMRIEKHCRDDQCMTLVGRVTDAQIDVELILSAGVRVLITDVQSDPWGLPSAAPLIFEAINGAGLVATKSTQGWIMTACTNCTDWGRDAVIVAPRPVPPVPPSQDTHEDFLRGLNLFQKN